jgi:cysteine desulfurase/selenocysteine lyase
MTTGDQYFHPEFLQAKQGMPQPQIMHLGNMLDAEYFDRLALQLYAEIPGSSAKVDGLSPTENSTVQLPMNSTSLRQLLDNLDESPVTSIPAIPHPGSRPEFYFLPGSEPRSSSRTYTSFDVHTIRRDFPILHQNVNGRPLVWLDNAATSQKPRQVIDALAHFYAHDNSNVHRGAHTLAARSTEAYEGAREKVQRFLGAASAREIIFVRGTTEGINLVAQTYGRKFIGSGDEIVLTTLEHHSNIVPWQFLAQEKGAMLRVAPIDDHGDVVLEEYERLLGPRTRLVAISQVSNALGTILPVAQMAEMAHRHGALVLVDGAQAVPHFRVNVQAMNADFYVFSGHKLFGPTGIGVLYGKLNLLENMPPWQGGGSMIDIVTFEATTYNEVPYKFEAGTGHIAGAAGLGAAIDYLDRIDFEAASLYEESLMAYATEAMAAIPGLRQIGTARHKAGVLSFVLDGADPQEVGKFLDQEGIAVRAGHHCAQPTMRRYGVTGTVRPSLAFYNTCEEIDSLVAAILKYKKIN